jgi:hypothetical protein
MTGHQRERQAELKNRFAALLGTPSSAPAPDKSKPKPAETEPLTSPPASQPRRTTRPRPASDKPALAAVEPMPIRQTTDETRPKRLMVPLSVDEDRALKEFRLGDGIAAAARVRAMLALYREDERFRRRVDAMARRMR